MIVTTAQLYKVPTASSSWAQSNQYLG